MRNMLLILTMLLSLLVSGCTTDPAENSAAFDSSGVETDISAFETVQEKNFVPAVLYADAEYTGLDVDLTFWRYEKNEPCRLWGPMASFFDEAPNIIPYVDDDWKPLYPGDYRLYQWDGFEVMLYTANNENHATAYQITTTRSDVYSYRGIGIGSTADEVTEAYPDAGVDIVPWRQSLQAGETNSYQYTPEEYWGSYSPLLIFYFEDEIVVQMELRYSPHSPKEYANIDLADGQ